MIRITLLLLSLLKRIVNRRRIHGPVAASVPASVVFASPRLRLDAGYYLGTAEEKELLRCIEYIERQLPATWSRFKRTLKAYVASRWRIYNWRKYFTKRGD